MSREMFDRLAGMAGMTVLGCWALPAVAPYIILIFLILVVAAFAVE